MKKYLKSDDDAALEKMNLKEESAERERFHGGENEEALVSSAG